MNTYFYLSLAPVIVAIYRSGQLAHAGQLRWSKNDDDFFGNKSYLRKYKRLTYPRIQPLEPAFWQSTGLLVFVTDWYHLSQWLWLHCFALLISKCITNSQLTIFQEFIVWLAVRIGLALVMWGTEKLLSKK
jgi:hypothetical protein